VRVAGDVSDWMKALRRHGRTQLVLEALLLFIVSSLLVELISRAGALAFNMMPPSVSNLCRWDCKWYASITYHGYQLAPIESFRGYSNWAFFPAFPFSARGLAVLTHIGTRLALILTSKAFYLLAIVVFMMLVRRAIAPSAALLAGAVLAFNPYMVYGHVGYSESLYFALSTLSFYFMSKQRWLAAGAIGGLLSGTRVVGLLIAIPYLVAVIRNRRDLRREWPTMLLGLLLIPLGIVLFALYLHGLMGDGLAFDHVQVAWGRSLGNPLEVLRLGFKAGAWDAVFATIGVVSLGMSVLLIVRREYEYGLFLLAATIIPISEGLLSLPRFVFWQMPFLYAVVRILHGRRWLEVAYFALAGGAAAFTLLGWFSGKSWII
jgi:hypothetical protein